MASRKKKPAKEKAKPPPHIDEIQLVRISQHAALVLFFVDIALVYLQDGFAYSYSKALRTLFFGIFAFIAYMGISDPDGTSSFNILTVSRGRSAGMKAPGCTYVVLGWIFLGGAFIIYGWRFLAYIFRTYVF